MSVAIFDDRLEVWSTGLLPEGLTPAKLKRSHESIPRNRLIAGTFYRRGLIEQWGRGTNRILAEAKKAGAPEPEFEEIATAFVVRFLPVPGLAVDTAPRDTPQVTPQVAKILRSATVPSRISSKHLGALETPPPILLRRKA